MQWMEWVKQRMMRVCALVEMMNVNEILEYIHRSIIQKLDKNEFLMQRKRISLPFELRSSVLNESILSSRSCSIVECVLS